MRPRRSLLVAILLVATLSAGCVETPDEPDAPEGPNASDPEGPDGPTPPSEPDEDEEQPNASDDDASATRPAPVDGVGDEPDAVAAHLADAVVSWWDGREVSRRQLRRGFRYVGVDARHVPDHGVVLVTAALC